MRGVRGGVHGRDDACAFGGKWREGADLSPGCTGIADTDVCGEYVDMCAASGGAGVQLRVRVTQTALGWTLCEER